jgi:hypothetical protein
MVDGWIIATAWWPTTVIYVQYSHRLSGGEDGVRWCQMVSCLSDACSVVSDGVEWVQLLSGGEDCVWW